MREFCRRISLMALSGLLVVTMAACSPQFDASAYVRSMLDAAYHGDFKEYMKIVNTDEADAQKSYQQNLELESEYFAKYFDIQILSDTTKKEIMDLYKDIYAKSKYVVKEAEKSGDGYRVEVVISPIDIMEQVEDDFNSYVDQFNAKNDAGDFDNFTQEQYEDTFAQGVIEIVKSYLPKLGYKDDVHVTVEVKKDDDGYWDIADDGFNQLDEAIISYS